MDLEKGPYTLTVVDEIFKLSRTDRLVSAGLSG